MRPRRLQSKPQKGETRQFYCRAIASIRRREPCWCLDRCYVGQLRVDKPQSQHFACDRKGDSLLSCDYHNDAQDSGVPTSFAEMRRNSLSSCPTKFTSLSTIRALACRIVLGKALTLVPWLLFCIMIA